MKLSRLGTCLALAAIALVAAAAGGGCEAIVSNDVPAYTCSMVQFLNPGNGSCPQGMFCEGAGCVACSPKGDDPCDGYDNDCDGVIDNGPKSDHDGDGYTYCGKVDPTTGAPVDIDCNDDDKTISPAGKEVCNGKDDNCDGIIDNANLVCAAGKTCVPSTGACISNAQTCSPTNCPAPKKCDPQTQQCVLPSSQDAGTTGCTSNEQCTTGICATSTELPGQQPVCTQPCCVSNDCPTGYVCYGAGTGGNYCVAPASASRTALGENAAGQACSGNGDCRSGVCTANKCEDTCCNASNCTNGTSCAVTAFQGNTTFACVPPPGNTAANHTCNSNSDCASGYCQSYTTGFGSTVSLCIPSCCSSNDCGTYGLNQFLCYDDYIPPALSGPGPVVPVCDYPQPSSGPSKGAGGSNVGDACTRNTDCYSNRCLIFSTGHFCSDVCCVDANCGGGYVCRPTPDGPGTFLRCVPPGG